MKQKFGKLLSDLIRIFKQAVKKSGWQLIVGLCLSIVTLLSFWWVANEVFQGEFDNFDATIRNGYQTSASPTLTAIMIFFTYLGSVYGIVALFAIATYILIIIRQKRAAVVLAIMMGGEVTLGIVLKLFFRRDRPEPFFDFTLPDSYSFPSGHAFASLCFFGTLAWIVSSRTENKKLWILAWIGAAILIFMIGSSRIYLGVHYPSDILAGYLAGIVWLSTVYSVDHRLNSRSREVDSG